MVGNEVQQGIGRRNVDKLGRGTKKRLRPTQLTMTKENQEKCPVCGADHNEDYGSSTAKLGHQQNQQSWEEEFSMKFNCEPTNHNQENIAAEDFIRRLLQKQREDILNNGGGGRQ